MPVTEKDGLMTFKDKNGNKTIIYPVTRKENVDGMEDVDKHIESRENPHGVTAQQAGAVPMPEGGTECQVLVKTKDGVAWGEGGGHLTSAAEKVSVLNSSGGLYYRTAAELRGDIDAAAKPIKGSFTIPTTGWGSDSTTGYTKYYDVAVSGVTASDRADVFIAPGSVNAAAACGMCPVSETLAGKIRIRASKVPTATISAEYWIEKE